MVYVFIKNDFFFNFKNFLDIFKAGRKGKNLQTEKNYCNRAKKGVIMHKKMHKTEDLPTGCLIKLSNNKVSVELQDSNDDVLRLS